MDDCSSIDSAEEEAEEAAVQDVDMVRVFQRWSRPKHVDCLPSSSRTYIS